MTDLPSTIPWYRSNTLRALTIAGVAQILSLTGAAGAISNDELARTVDAVLKLAETGALIWAFYARARQPSPPVTLRKEIQ